MYNEYTVKSGSNKWVNFLVDMHLRKLQTLIYAVQSFLWLWYSSWNTVIIN